MINADRSPRRTIATAQTLYHRFHLFFPYSEFHYIVSLLAVVDMQPRHVMSWLLIYVGLPSRFMFALLLPSSPRSPSPPHTFHSTFLGSWAHDHR